MLQSQLFASQTNTYSLGAVVIVLDQKWLLAAIRAQRGAHNDDEEDGESPEVGRVQRERRRITKRLPVRTRFTPTGEKIPICSKSAFFQLGYLKTILMLMLLPAVWSEARARRWRTVVRIAARRSHCGGDVEHLICWQLTIWRSFDLSKVSTSMINFSNWVPQGREGHRGSVGQNEQPGDSCQPGGPHLKQTMMEGKIRNKGAHVALQKSERAGRIRQCYLSFNSFDPFHALCWQTELFGFWHKEKPIWWSDFMLSFCVENGPST